jgi:hypothetical protein
MRYKKKNTKINKQLAIYLQGFVTVFIVVTIKLKCKIDSQITNSLKKLPF